MGMHHVQSRSHLPNCLTHILSTICVLGRVADSGNCVARDEERVNQGKGSGYGHSNALLLAKENPAAARENADSYAMFATGAYFEGIENWETNPNQICGRR